MHPVGRIGPHLIEGIFGARVSRLEGFGEPLAQGGRGGAHRLPFFGRQVLAQENVIQRLGAGVIIGLVGSLGRIPKPLQFGRRLGEGFGIDLRGGLGMAAGDK